MKHILIKSLDSELHMISDSVELSYNPPSHSFRDFYDDSYNLNRYLKKFYLIIYDANEEPLFSSPLARKISLDVPLNIDSIEKGYTISKKADEVPMFRSNGNKDSNEKITFRAISRKMLYNGQPIGWIKLAIPIVDIQHSLRNLFYILIIGILFTSLLIGFGSYFLTSQSLSPVLKIIDQSKNISQSNLDERISIYNAADELGQLSIVLNNLFERLQKAFASQQHFLADAAHELKTPLSILRANWEQEINNPDFSDETKGKIVHDIETISRLNQLVNNLLLLSRTEAIQSHFDFDSIPLDGLIKEIYSDAQIIAETKEQEIQIVELTNAIVLGDKIRLSQLIFNLIDNAIKYTPERGKIWISLRSENHQAIIEIRDNGTGIHQNELSKIFDRFYRVEKDRSRKTGGSGLGLAICKLIAEAHHGEIAVESTMGKGSLFRVVLPLIMDV
jgi:signal transduction histidine kinase